MHRLRKILLLLLPVLLLFGAMHLYNRLTDGFSVRQITSTLPYNAFFEITTPTAEEKKKLESMLDQPYRYLSKGCQFYVFESADGQYVIKFLKQKHLRQFTNLMRVPMPHLLRQKIEAQVTRRKARVFNLFSSCKLSFEELVEESGLIYVHLNRTPIFDKELILVDKLGLKHRIDLDKHEFILQKKARPAEEVFAALAASADTKELAYRVQQLVDLVRVRCKKGIRDRDRSFVQNVAFSVDGTSALFTDVGQFYKDPTIVSPEELQKEIKRRLGNLRYWIEERYPTMSDALDTCLNEIVHLDDTDDSALLSLHNR